MKFKASYYTTECVCVLYENIKDDFSTTKVSYTHIEVKYYLAIYNLLDTVILKLKTALLKAQESQEINIKITEYQGYFLSQFLFENRHKYKGIAERTFLNTLAINLDKEL